MSTGRADRTCLLNSGLPEWGVWCESTAFRHSCVRSSKRAGGIIPRIAPDQCRVPERYRTRAPIQMFEQEVTEPTEQEEWPSPLYSFASVVSFRNRASVQAGIISQLRRGQHSGLRPAFVR
jgi:hypothetical protein